MVLVASAFLTDKMKAGPFIDSGFLSNNTERPNGGDEAARMDTYLVEAKLRQSRSLGA